MSEHDHPPTEASSDQDEAAAPAMPEIPSNTLYPGTPYVLVDSGVQHSIGWTAPKRSDPQFVVVRNGWSGSSKVIERFPLTEDGWASAWRALSALDAPAAEALARRLGRLEGRRRASTDFADLDAQALGSLVRVTYRGGSGDAQLIKGKFYDVRFLPDRIMVSPAGAPHSVTELPYGDVRDVEISGLDRTTAPGLLALHILGLALLGGVLGLLIHHRWTWLVAGALISAAIGAVVGVSAATIKTTIRIGGVRAELFFLNRVKRADQLRIDLSEALRAIASNGQADLLG